MKLQNCELKRLLPVFMKEQKDVAALADALDPLIRQIGALLPLMSDYESIDDLPEEVLDLLAHELSIDWYKKTEPPSIKRAVVSSSDSVHMTLGTPEAVRQVAADFYGDAKIEEWFEYDGIPGHFRISVLENGGSLTTPDELYDLVRKVKRAGAVMDGVDFSWENYLGFFAGIAEHSSGKGADIDVPLNPDDLEWETPESAYMVFYHFQTYQQSLFIDPTPDEASWGAGLSGYAAMRHKQSYVQKMVLTPTPEESEWRSPLQMTPASVDTFMFRSHAPLTPTPEESEWSATIHEHTAPAATLVTTLPEISITP